MLSTPTFHIICCWDDHGFIATPSSPLLSIKSVDEDGKVRTLIAERHPFKGVENYFTDSLLYQDSLETDENP